MSVFTELFKLVTQYYFAPLKTLLFLMSLIPLVLIIGILFGGLSSINPLAEITRISGHSAVIFLIITLSITPLKRISSYIFIRLHSLYGKRLSDWNWIIRLRKMFGLYCFFYTAIHLIIYLWFDLSLDFSFILDDINDRPFIMVGFVSFILLFTMALTSPNFMIRKLKTSWKYIHKSIYLVAVLILLHYWWLVKPGNLAPVTYTVLLSLLLSYRVLEFLRIIKIRPGDTGMLVTERTQVNS